MAKRSRDPAQDDRETDAVLERIRAERSFDFRNYKRATLRRRIERRMLERRCETIAEYQAVLERDPLEFDALIASMLIKVTSFFRDPEMWERLETEVVPALLAAKKEGEELRVWCAGCATGEEAFSIAILIAEALGGSARRGQEVKVFGTDVDETAIAHARRGTYPLASLGAVSAERRSRWFVPEAGGWSVNKEIRRSVVFGVNNLVGDAPISRLDLLLCRNVFIYLDSQLQKRVLTRFHYALRRHGVLVLGKSELIPFAARIYEPIDLGRRIYRKDGHREPTAWQDHLVPTVEAAPEPPQPQPQGQPPQPLHIDVLQSLPLPVVATSLDGTVLFWNIAAAALWSRAESETTGKKLVSLNLPGLSGEQLVAQSQAVREGRVNSAEGDGSFTRQGAEAGQRLRVSIVPLHDGDARVTGLLYTFHDVTSLTQVEGELRKSSEERLSALEALRTTNEEIQSSNEELETTNEELQSSNEELQTTNEELQSTNEELETTNEELQSTNAELDATNRELAHRTDEMNRLGFYQRTIIRSLSAAVIVIDAGARITLWNLAAERLLGLTEIEAMGQVLWTLHVPALARPVLQKVRKSLGSRLSVRLEDVEYELPTGGSGRAVVVAVPIIDGGEPLGAVVLFEDGTRVASLAEELARIKGKKSRGQAKDS